MQPDSSVEPLGPAQGATLIKRIDATDERAEGAMLTERVSATDERVEEVSLVSSAGKSQPKPKPRQKGKWKGKGKETNMTCQATETSVSQAAPTMLPNVEASPSASLLCGSAALKVLLNTLSIIGTPNDLLEPIVDLLSTFISNPPHEFLPGYHGTTLVTSMLKHTSPMNEPGSLAMPDIFQPDPFATQDTFVFPENVFEGIIPPANTTPPPSTVPLWPTENTPVCITTPHAVTALILPIANSDLTDDVPPPDLSDALDWIRMQYTKLVNAPVPEADKAIVKKVLVMWTELEKEMGYRYNVSEKSLDKYFC
jgi:hypothetical protein